MGLVMGWLARTGPSEPLRLFLAVGLLGGFTTFSAFSLDVFTLIERREILMAVMYAAGSVLAGLAAFFVGYAALRSVGG
jgi:CrcB protein